MNMYLKGKTKKISQGFLASIVSFAFLFAPISQVFAKTTVVEYTGTGINLDYPASVETDLGQEINVQTESQIYGLTPEGSGGNAYDLAKSGSSEFAACSLTSLISKLITTFITTLIENILLEKIENAIRSTTKVPVVAPKTDEIVGASRSKDVCSLQLYGVCILPSLNSLFYCLVNSVIQYVGQATVKWINSGFEGNPVFIDNPDQYFKDAADHAAGNFINSISDGLLCEPFRAQTQVNLLNHYLSSSPSSFSSNYGSCSLSSVSSDIGSFVGGSFSDGGGLEALRVIGWDDASNPYGSELAARDALWKTVNSQDKSLKLQYQATDGWLHAKNPETGRIETHGKIIQDLVNKRLFNGEQRLLFATQFDQIITALVNQLVKIALNEVLKVTE